MSLLREMSRAYLINRVARGGRHRSYPRGYGRRPRGRGGFFGPFPYYSGRTRRGSRVTVSGCCLPIPLGVVATVALAARAFAGR